MWPYTGRKLRQSLEVNGNNTQFSVTPSGTDLNKEYFNRINSSGSNFTYYSSYRVEQDGRALQTQAVEPKDVTDKVCTNDIQERKRDTNDTDQGSKQLHIRNVTQLKFALDMPEKQRQVSLSHITGAIIRNEIAPTLRQLQDVDFVRTNLPKDHELPPIRRKSFEKAKPVQTMTVKSHQKLSSVRRRKTGQMYLPAMNAFPSKDGIPVKSERELFPYQTGHILKDYAQKISSGSQFKYSPNHSGLVNTDTQNNEDKVYETGIKKSLRNDSIGKLTNEISDQFKQIILMSKTRTNETDKLQTAHVSGHLSNSTDPATMDRAKSGIASYKRRHEYGKNLEKNWFKSFMQKHKTKLQNDTNSYNKHKYDMRLDIFYSPEPEPDEEYEESDNDNIDDDVSMHCGGYSSATTEQQFKKESVRSMNAEEYTIKTDDELSSGSDIEIILKDDQLIQRKTKHKNRKKRKRQLKRYKAFMPAQMDIVKEGHEETEVTLTDQEIRAIRLNLRNKERMKKLKGKRRFLQAANAVYIAVQFKNILQKIRHRKLKEIRRKQMKIASVIAKRWRHKVSNQEDCSQSSPTQKTSLKELFMKSVGKKLVHDVACLRLLNDVEEEGEGEKENINELMPSRSNDQSRPITKYERELRKVSKKDIEIAFPANRKHVTSNRSRRTSIPVSIKPAEFLIEIHEKSKRSSKIKAKQNKGQPVKNEQSPSMRKCACIRHRNQDLALPCQHQPETIKPKTKVIAIPTTGLMRTYSLQDLSTKEPIELWDLLEGVDIPAKEIKLEILARKFRKQRRKKEQVLIHPCITPTDVMEQRADESCDSLSRSSGSNDSDVSDYEFVYGGPFVGSGVMWNQNSTDRKEKTWTAEDVDRELKRITRIFHDMKECRYLRLDGLNQAILGRLRENSF